MQKVIYHTFFLFLNAQHDNINSQVQELYGPHVIDPRWIKRVHQLKLFFTYKF